MKRTNACIADHYKSFIFLSKWRSKRWWKKHDKCYEPYT